MYSRRNHLNLVAVGCANVFPVHHARCSAHCARHIHQCVLNANAPMRACAKDEVVLRSGIRLALRVQPTLRFEYMWVLVDVGVVEGRVNRRDDHAVVRYCILVVDREGFGSFIRYLQ